MANKRVPGSAASSHSSSLEDYLEAILAISSESGGDVGITELGERLGVSKPSVTMAVKKLVAIGLVEHEPYGRIELTSEGRRHAAEVARKHDLLVRFLRDVLGVDPRIAEVDACRLEHEVSSETTEKLSQFVSFLTGSDGDRSTEAEDFSKFTADGLTHRDLVRDWGR